MAKAETREREGEGEGSRPGKQRSAKGGNGSGKLVFGAIGGALSGLLPRLVTYPLETLKSRSQVQSTIRGSGGSATRTNVVKMVKETWIRHGPWKGFFPGVHVALLGTIPGSATYFFGYELGKSMYASDFVQQALKGTSLGSSVGLQGAFCGVSAQCVANLIFTPIDIVKERMQVQAALLATGKQTRLYTTAEVVASIARKEGLHVFMRGYWKGNMLWMPWSTIYISTYESLKDLKKDDWGNKEATNSENASSSSSSRTLHLGLCAAVASAVASISTHPIDVVKTRIQALPSEMWNHQKENSSQLQHQKQAGHNTLGMLHTIWAKEGIKGLFAGLHLRVLQLSPATVMTWLIYEHLSDLFQA